MSIISQRTLCSTTNRSTVSIKKSQKKKSDGLPFTLTFNPHKHLTKSIIFENFKLPQKDPETSSTYSQTPLASLKRGKNIGNFPVRLTLFTIYGKSGSKVNGTPLFGFSQRKISGSNETSEKVVLFIRMEYSKRKFVIHFFKAIFNTSFRPSRP